MSEQHRVHKTPWLRSALTTKRVCLVTWGRGTSTTCTRIAGCQESSGVASADSMSDGAKLALSATLLAVGGMAAWWAFSPSTKTASGPALRATYPGLGVAPGLTAINADYQAGYAAGQHAGTLANIQQQAAPGLKAVATPPPGHSSAWILGITLGTKALTNQRGTSLASSRYCIHVGSLAH